MRANCDRRGACAGKPGSETQRGSVLIIGLIMMVVLTMIGLTGMQTTTQQERMSGNARDRNIAFQATEFALRTGELEVCNIERGLSALNGSGRYDRDGGAGAGPSDTDLEKDATWTAANSIPVGAIAGSAGVPVYMIEKQKDRALPKDASVEAGKTYPDKVYKVTARGVGASDTAVVVLQATFGPRGAQMISDTGVPFSCTPE